MKGGFSPLNIGQKMLIGFVLILLWLPAIFMSEINNKNNKSERRKLEKNINNSFLKTGKIISDSIKTNIWGNNVNFKKSVGGMISQQQYIQYYKKVKDSYGYTRNRLVRSWSKPINSEIKYKDFYIKFTDGTKLYVNQDLINPEDLLSITYPAYRNDVDISNNLFWSGNTFSNNRYTNLGDYKYNVFKIPTDKTITVFAKNENLDKVEDDSTKLFYKGRVTKEQIINKKKEINTTERWLFRIGTFFMLFIGLALIAEPLKEILKGTSNIFNLPILNILKPIIDAIGGVVVFLWDSLSFFGALILTLILTAIVYFLVNYTLVVGIGLGFIIVLLLIPVFMKNKNI